MRIVRSAAGILLLMTGIIMTGAGLNVDAHGAELSNYLGEFCWMADSGALVKGGFAQVGAGHFLFIGRATDDGGGITPFIGNAEVKGDKVHAALTTAQGDADNTTTTMGFMLLNLPGLDGTIEFLGIVHDKNDPDPEHAALGYDTDTLTRVACP